MTENHAVTAIIPVHNREMLIGEAIDSVLKQSRSAAEVIVVDDGSTDDTPGILRSYGDSIKVITQEQQGRSAARNTAIRAAECPVIAFLDSDDRWHRDKLARQLDLLEHLGPSLITGYIRAIDEEGLESSSATLFAKHRLDQTRARGFDARSLVLQPAVYTSNWLVPKRLLEKVGMFDETLHALEDWDLLFRLGTQTRVDSVAWPPIIDYRIHTGNTPGDAKARDAVIITRKHLDDPRITDVTRGALNLVLARNLRSLGDQRGARAACVRAASEDPKFVSSGLWWRLLMGASLPRPLIEMIRSLRTRTEEKQEP